MMKWSLGLLFFAALASCTPQSLSPIELVEWVEDESNGLRVKQTVGSIAFDLQYQPVDYLVAIQEKKAELSDKVYDEIKSNKEGLHYFRVRMQRKDAKGDLVQDMSSDYSEYEKLVEYLSFNIQNDFTLVEGADSVKCTLHHFERSYQSAPYSTLLLGFEKGKSIKAAKNGLRLIYDDNIFSVGQVNFVINSQAISNTPSLKTISQ